MLLLKCLNRLVSWLILLVWRLWMLGPRIIMHRGLVCWYILLSIIRWSTLIIVVRGIAMILIRIGTCSRICCFWSIELTIYWRFRLSKRGLFTFSSIVSLVIDSDWLSNWILRCDWPILDLTTLILRLFILLLQR